MPGRQESFSERQELINRQIREGEFSPVYLVYGSQAYLRRQNVNKLTEAMLAGAPAEGNMNYARFTGADVTAQSVIETAETMPFFADRRVIVLDETGFFDRAEEGDALAERLGTFPPSTCIIIAQTKPDKRRRLYKAAAEAGTVLDCDTISDQEIRAWAASLFRREGILVSGPDLAMFLDRTGPDMMNIACEAEKLICYCMSGSERTATRGDIEKVTSPVLRDRVFEMTDAIARRRPDEALAIYLELRRIQTSPQQVLALMQRQFSQLLQLEEMEHGGYFDERAAAAAVGVPPFIVSRKMRPCLRHFADGQLRAALEGCLQADQDYKAGRVDAGIAVEMLIAGCGS